MVLEDYEGYSVSQFARVLWRALFEYYEALETRSQKFFYLEGVDPLDGKTPGESIRVLYLGLKTDEARDNFVYAIKELLETRLHMSVSELFQDILCVTFDLRRHELLVPLAKCFCRRQSDTDTQKLVILTKILLIIGAMREHPSAQKAVRILKKASKTFAKQT